MLLRLVALAKFEQRSTQQIVGPGDLVIVVAKVGGQGDGLLQQLGGPRGLPGVQIDLPEKEIGIGGVRPQLHGPGQMGLGGGIVMLSQLNDARVVPAEIMVRVGLQLRLEVFPGLVKALRPSLQQVSQSQVVMRPRVAGIFRDGLLELGDGLVIEVRFPVSAAEKDVQRRRRAHRVQELVEQEHGFGQLLQFEVGQGQAVSRGEVWLELQGFFQLLGRRLEIPLHKINLSQQVGGADVVGVVAQDDVHGCRRLSQLVLPVVGDGQGYPPLRVRRLGLHGRLQQAGRLGVVAFGHPQVAQSLESLRQHHAVVGFSPVQVSGQLEGLGGFVMLLKGIRGLLRSHA